MKPRAGMSVSLQKTDAAKVENQRFEEKPLKCFDGKTVKPFKGTFLPVLKEIFQNF